MNVLALVAGCDYTDPRTDPSCYSDGAPTGLRDHATNTWSATWDQILHPALSWPGLLGYVIWGLAVAVVVTAARSALKRRGKTGTAGTAAKGAAGGVRGMWGVFAKARTQSQSVHVPTVEGEPQ